MPVHMHRKIAIAFFSAIFSSSLLISDFGTGTDANAQSIKSRTDNRLFLKQQRLRNAVELNRLGFDRSGVLLRPGVINRGLRSGSRGFNNRGFANRSGVNLNNNFRNDRGFELFERRRLNALRNIAIEGQRTGVVQGSVPNDIFILDDGNANAATSGYAVSRAAPACPSNHNCGYRVYEDGTGPRIITPGAGGLEDGLPAFDGVSGPLIITLDE